MADSDIARYRVEVHGLKSASANIGALDVSNMARAQENAAAQGDTEFIQRQFPPLLEAYETLLMNIGLFLEEQKQNEAQEEKLPPRLIGPPCPPPSCGSRRRRPWASWRTSSLRPAPAGWRTFCATPCPRTWRSA